MYAILALSSVMSIALAGLTGCQMPASSHNAEGVKQFNQGQYQAATDRFQAAIASNPDNPDAYYNMAATLHDWGRKTNNQELLTQAEGMYHKCLDLNPDHVDCYRGLAVLLIDTDRRESAFTLLERWDQRSPTRSDAKVELARLHEEFGENELAKQYLSKAIDAQATDPRAWAALGRIREQEGQLAQALTNYQQAYSLNRAQPGIAERIASLQQSVATSGTAGAPQTRTAAVPSTAGTSSSPWVAR